MSDHLDAEQPPKVDSPAVGLSTLVRARQTTKVLASAEQQIQFPPDQTIRLNALVRNAIADAGYAPFHYDRKRDGLAEPWRFHVLWQPECRMLSRRIREWFADLNPTNKLPAMLAACGAVVLVNWLPQSGTGQENDKLVQINEEHLAATAAAIQILLLKLTAEKLHTYWSSGGQFRTTRMFKKLGISGDEKLLGAIFVDYGATGDQVEIILGKNRDRRSDFRNWTNEITLECNEKIR